MRYLFTKMRRDISKMWVQFFSVFMMSVLAITIYSGMEGVWYGLQCEVEEYYEKTQLADAWVNGINITEEMVSEIEEEPYVDCVEKSMTTMVTLVDENEKPDIKLMSMEEQSLFKPYIIEGREYDSTSDDGIWIDETFAKERNIAIGNTIELTYGPCIKEFNVEGFILHSEFIYYTGSITDTVPNHKLHGYGLISNDAAMQFYGKVICNELRINLNGNCEYNEVQQRIEEILGTSYHSFLVRDDISSVSQIEKEINQMQSMANLFSAVFILLALLSMYTTMTRLINTQQVQIGTLKAIGFSDFKIRLHYIFYGMFVSLAGCFIGTFFGKLLVSKAVMKVKKATLTMPIWQVELSYRTYIIIAGIVFVCVLATVLASSKSLKKLPCESMRAEAAGTNNKKGLINPERLLGWNKLEYNTKWMIRDIFQNKTRWIMSIIGVAGSMVLMMAGLGFKDSIDFSNDYVYNEQFTYEYKIVCNPQYSDEAFDELMSLTKNEVQQIYEVNLEMYYSDGELKEMRVLSVLDEGDYIHLEDLNGDSVQLANTSVAISKKTAEKLNVGIGDKIKCRIIGEIDFVEFTITDIVVSPSPQGIFISSEYWNNELDRNFVASSLLVSERDYEAIKDLEIIKETASIEQQLSNMKIMTKSVMTIIYLMIVASVLLGGIIIYNLGMLNYVERFREYATMKVLGFYQREVRSVIIRDCMITTIIGWLVGIPIGFKFLDFYIGIVQFKSFEWVPTLNNSSLVIASIAVICCSVVVNLIVAHKVTKISMVEALKSVE